MQILLTNTHRYDIFSYKQIKRRHINLERVHAVIMRILELIQTAIIKSNYAVRPHTVTHMFSEGFDEGNIVEAIVNGIVLEHYYDE